MLRLVSYDFDWKMKLIAIVFLIKKPKTEPQCYDANVVLSNTANAILHES